MKCIHEICRVHEISLTGMSGAGGFFAPKGSKPTKAGAYSPRKTGDLFAGMHFPTLINDF